MSIQWKSLCEEIPSSGVPILMYCPLMDICEMRYRIGTYQKDL